MAAIILRTRYDWYGSESHVCQSDIMFHNAHDNRYIRWNAPVRMTDPEAEAGAVVPAPVDGSYLIPAEAVLWYMVSENSNLPVQSSFLPQNRCWS